ncbi:hypothetical protein [Shewanella dokdonensis]|uniref:hypothetical protein n=1 Tax=Shewanella dokdonensis TaxID=712036 RepID=UPI00200EEE9F|nr:hypothetical protein [Shewanella dokdonensis]MCL1075340.1 hypothetical protein [Shewanella dokdonensis]
MFLSWRESLDFGELALGIHGELYDSVTPFRFLFGGSTNLIGQHNSMGDAFVTAS